jgi:hypothetical protein
MAKQRHQLSKHTLIHYRLSYTACVGFQIARYVSYLRIRKVHCIDQDCAKPTFRVLVRGRKSQTKLLLDSLSFEKARE